MEVTEGGRAQKPIWQNSTQAQPDILDIYLRQRQWFMMLAGQGRWKAFCECLPHFREYLATWNKDDAEMSAEVVAPGLI